MSPGSIDSTGPTGRTRRWAAQQSRGESPGAGPVKTCLVPSGDT